MFLAPLSTYQRRTKMKNVVTKGTKRIGLKLAVPLAQRGTAHDVQMSARIASVKAIILERSREGKGRVRKVDEI